jgi:hypothetical protein
MRRERVICGKTNLIILSRIKKLTKCTVGTAFIYVANQLVSMEERAATPDI